MSEGAKKLMSEEWGLWSPAPPACPPRDEVPDLLSGRTWVVSQWRQSAQTGNSGWQTNGLPEVVGSSPPRPLMNLFPLISGVSFEGKGMAKAVRMSVPQQSWGFIASPRTQL